VRSIFISYRREDAEGEAGRLFDDLVEEFGEHSVFMDVAAIEVGRDFRKIIDDSVATCGVLLAIIGRNWLDAKDEAGTRRLDDPSDFVRLETASALKRDIPVIPVLVHGARMPRAEQLPDNLQELAYRNGVELTGPRWRGDVQLLIKALRPHVAERPVANGDSGRGTKPTPAPVPAPRPTVPTARFRRMGLIITATAAILAVVAAIIGISLRKVTVPDLSGIALTDATAKLQALNLAVGQETYREDATKHPQTVLSQSPSPGTSVNRGSAIDLVLSKELQLVVVPALLGKSLEDARQALADAHLEVGRVGRQASAGKPPDVVVGASPAVGARVASGSKVDLEVSKGATSTAVRVPDLVGESLDKADARLQRDGLSVGSIKQQESAGSTAGVVLQQSPASGQKVQAGARVDLTVSKQPKLVPPIKLTAYSRPSVIAPGGQAEITAVARAPDGAVIPNATVTVGAGGGVFSGSGTNTVTGNSDKNGNYRTIWRAPAPAAKSYVMGVKASRAGFETTQVQVTVGINQPSARAADRYPNFAGTWQMFESTYNGATKSLPQGQRITIQQNGATVTISGKEHEITSAGTVTYKQFYAGPSPGHSVQTEAEADLVDTFTCKVEGDLLLFETKFAYKRPYGGHPPGTDVRIFKYRRVAH
jgi:beta-lactam-binding protein with PASTA domain